MRNDGKPPAEVEFRVDAAENAPTVTPATAVIPSLGVKRVTLTFKPSVEGEAVSGELIVSARGSVPAGVAFEFSVTPGTPRWIYYILFLPLALALALVLARWFSTKYPCGLGGRLGPANWDFSKSWGSNLTVVGALLGTIIATSVLPDTTSAAKGTYAALNLFFGALIVIAPFIYTATQRAEPFHKTKTVKEPQFQGYVWSFLLATVITLWAVLGEIGATFAVFNEIRVGHTMPGASLVVFAVLLGISGGLMLVMSWRRIKQTIVFQCDRPKQRRRHLELHAQLSNLAGDESEVAPGKELVEPELPTWSVL